MKIKICGLSRECDIDFVNKACPDYVGFVFAESKRQVTQEQAKVLRARLEGSIPAVGVFVNADMDQVLNLLQDGVIQVVQLHGQEDEVYVKRLRDQTKAPIIKAVSVATRDDVKRAMDTVADYLLFDHGKGGTGQAFDWNLISSFSEKLNKPFFLAGGLSLRNIHHAIELAKPYGVDISSGVETDGLKDEMKIMEIIRKIREETRKNHEQRKIWHSRRAIYTGNLDE